MPTPTVSNPTLPPEIPDNAFIFDPDVYSVSGGKLKFNPNNQIKKRSYLGYYLIGLGILLVVCVLLSGPINFIGGFFLAFVVILFCSAGVYLIFYKLNRDYFHRNGKVALGKIISIHGKTVKYAQKYGAYSRHYEITAKFSFYKRGHKTKIIGTTTQRRGDLRGKPLPRAGTPVVILYVDSDNYIAC